MNFRPADAAALRAIVDPGEFSLEGTRIDIPGRIEWWPALLRQQLDPERIAATGLKAYAARGSDLIFAVDWDQGRAYYWTKE